MRGNEVRGRGRCAAVAGGNILLGVLAVSWQGHGMSKGNCVQEEDGGSEEQHV